MVFVQLVRSSSSLLWRKGNPYGLRDSPVAVHFVVDVPVVQLQPVSQVVDDRCWVDSECRILWKFRSCRSSKFFNIRAVAQRLFPMVFQTSEIPQLLVDMVIDVPVVQVVQVSQIVHIPVVVQRPFPTVSDHGNSLLVDKVVDLRVLLVVRVQQVPSWRRQSCSHSCTC